jgi:hypothetical protein
MLRLPAMMLSRAKRNRPVVSVISLALGLVALAVVIQALGTEEINRLSTANPIYVASAISTLVATTLLSAWRWAHITDAIAGRRAMSFRHYYMAFIITRALGMVVAQGPVEMAGRAASLTGIAGLRVGQAIDSVVYDRAIDMLLLSLLIIPGVFLLLAPLAPSLSLGAFALACVLALVAVMKLQLIVNLVTWTLVSLSGWVSKNRLAQASSLAIVTMVEELK